MNIYQMARQRMAAFDLVATRSHAAEAALAHKAERNRKWREANPDKVVAMREREREREKTPERKAMHKAWDKSPEGILSWEKRYKKWRTSEKGRETCRRKSLRFYARHKDEPEFKAKKSAWGKAFRLRHVPGKLRQVDYTLTLHGVGTFTAHVLTTRRDAA